MNQPTSISREQVRAAEYQSGETHLEGAGLALDDAEDNPNAMALTAAQHQWTWTFIASLIGVDSAAVLEIPVSSAAI